MKLLRREIAKRCATRQLLKKKPTLDTNRITKLTGEIFELQRTLLTRYQAKGMLTTA